jgi:hypothetical protein
MKGWGRLSLGIAAATIATLAFTAQGQDPQAAKMPTFKEITGPGALFPALQRLPADEDLAHFKYIVKEYFVQE